jgi:archaemetzincin
VIQLVPVGDVGPDLLHALIPVIEARFAGRLAQVAARGVERPDEAFAAERRQYRAEPILRRLAGLDLFTPDLNFIFGQARPGGPAIMSLARLRPEFWGRPPDAVRLRERADKEAVHELGHSYGLGHCRDAGCVMWFSNTLAETDAKSDAFCARHATQLDRALGATHS